MAESQSNENATREKARHTATPAQRSAQEDTYAPELPTSATSLLGDPRLNGRGNQPVKNAVMQRMQRTSGNRATQRYLQRATTTNPATRAQAQTPSSTTLSIQAQTGENIGYQPVQRQGNKGTPATSTNFIPKSGSYTITGSTLQDAFDEMSQRIEAGETAWNPVYTVNRNDAGNVTGVTINVEITVTMPSWPNASKLGKDAKAEWDRFYAALDKHEKEHVALVKAKFKGVAQSMLGKPESDAATLFQDAVDGLKTDSDAFDTATNHGQNNGTILDVSKDPPKKVAPAPATP